MLKKYLIIIGAVVFLIGASVNVSAEADGTGDLFHYKEDSKSVSGWSFEQYSGEKPNIDITDLSYTSENGQLTITMTVNGQIEDKAGLAYYVYILRDEVGAGNLAYYTNSFYYVWGDTMESSNSDMTSRAGSDTITFTMDYSTPENITGIRGYTYEAADSSLGTNGEYWGDWAPDTYFPAYADFYGSSNDGEDTSEEGNGETTDEGDGTTTGEEDVTNGEDTTEGGEENSGSEKTPGFEILTLVASVAIALILLRKRK